MEVNDLLNSRIPWMDYHQMQDRLSGTPVFHIKGRLHRNRVNHTVSWPSVFLTI